MPVYQVPVVVEGGVEQPVVDVPADTDCNRHYRGGTVYVASRTKIDACEDHLDVTVVDDASGAAAGTEEYPAPEASTSDEDDSDESDAADGDDSDDAE